LKVAGLTCTSDSLWLTLLDEDSDDCSYRRAELLRAGTPFERALTIEPRVKAVCPGGWEQVRTLAVERPDMLDVGLDVGYLADAMRIQGAVLACLFSVTSDVDVFEKPAHLWRLALCGYTPDANDVILKLQERGLDLLESAPQPAWDALGLAWAAREDRRVLVHAARELDERGNGVGADAPAAES
jgi:hypothetical protein